MRHRLSKTADRDVARLFRQSVLGFGVAHANQYLARLDRTFEQIGELPRAAPERMDLRGSVRIWRFEAHHIVYRIVADEVLIVRVLHGRQDMVRYL